MSIEVRRLEKEAIFILNGFEIKGWYPEISAPNYIDKGVIVIPNDRYKNNSTTFWDFIKAIDIQDFPNDIQFDISQSYKSITPPLDKVSYPFSSVQIGIKDENIFIRFNAITQRGYEDDWDKKWAIKFYFNAFKKFEEKPLIKVIKSEEENEFWTLDIEIQSENANTIEEAFDFAIVTLSEIFEKVELSLAGLDNFMSVVELWNKNQNEKDEKFWQKLIRENAWLISLAFNQPFFLFKNEGYLGGKSIGNIKGKVVDFIYKNKLTNNIALIEIKTPLGISKK